MVSRHCAYRATPGVDQATNRLAGRQKQTSSSRDGPCFIIEFSWRLSAELRITHVFYCSDNTEFNFTRSMVHKKRFFLLNKTLFNAYFPFINLENLFVVVLILHIQRHWENSEKTTNLNLHRFLKTIFSCRNSKFRQVQIRNKWDIKSECPKFSSWTNILTNCRNSGTLKSD